MLKLLRIFSGLWFKLEKTFEIGTDEERIGGAVSGHGNQSQLPL